MLENETTMQNKTIYSDNINSVVSRLIQFTKDIDDTDIKAKVAHVAKDKTDTFLLVVIGEVKAGKSSFINGLLGEDICAVSSAPCTNIIHEIRYGGAGGVVEISEMYKQHYVSNELLKEISIVDTPGSDSIVAGHQTLSEKIIPESDLLVIVLPATNVHKESVWELIREINSNWKKNCIFIIQQKDLVSHEMLQRNIASIRNYAIQMGILDPLIFPVSAEDEINGLSDSSGYNFLRSYLKHNILDLNPIICKQRTDMQLTNHVLKSLRSSMGKRVQQHNHDLDIVERINDKLDKFHIRNRIVVDDLVTNILREIDNEIEIYRKDVISVLEPLTLKKRFDSKSKFEEWLFEENRKASNMLQKKVERRVLHASKCFLNDITDIFGESCKYLEERNEILNSYDSVYGSIALKKANVIKEIDRKRTQIYDTNKTLSDLSLELFDKIVQECDKYDKKVNATTGAVGIASATGATFAAIKTSSALGTIISGMIASLTATATSTTATAAAVAQATSTAAALTAAAPFIIGAGVICAIVAGIIISTQITEATHGLSKAIYAPGLFKKVDKHLSEYNNSIRENATIIKERIELQLRSQFEEEVKLLENSFKEFRLSTYMDSEIVPDLEAQLSTLENESKRLLIKMAGGMR